MMLRSLACLLIVLPVTLRAQAPSGDPGPPRHVLLLPPARVSIDRAIRNEVDLEMMEMRSSLVALKEFSLHARDSILGFPGALAARKQDTADVEAYYAQFPADAAGADFGALLLQREHAFARHLARKRHNKSRIYAAFDHDPADTASVASMIERSDASIIVAIPSVELKRILVETSLFVHYQFYERGSRTPFLDTTIVAGTGNEGGLTTCDDGTFDCAINNATATIAMQLAYGLLTGRWEDLHTPDGDVRRK